MFPSGRNLPFQGIIGSTPWDSAPFKSVRARSRVLELHLDAQAPERILLLFSNNTGMAWRPRAQLVKTLQFVVPCDSCLLS